MERHVSELLNRYKGKKILKRAMALVCAFVLLFTMNSLKRTADTLSRKPMCGIKKHQHSAKCYDADGELTCGKVEHVHTDACYQMRPVEGDLLVTEDADETVAEADQNLTLAEEQSAENQQTSVESNTEQTLVDIVPEYRLGEKARLSRIIEKTGLGIKLKKVIEVGVVDDDGTKADLIKVTPRGSDYVIKAQKDFKEVELALVLKDEVRTVKLVQGKAPAQEEAPAANANNQPVSNAAPKTEKEEALTVEEAKGEENENTDTEDIKIEEKENAADEEQENKEENSANEETKGDKEAEKSGEEGQADSNDNVGTEKTGEETTSEQTEEKSDEKSDEEAGEQTGDEAGEQTGEEAGEQTSEEAGEKSDEEAGEEAGKQTGEENEEKSGEEEQAAAINNVETEQGEESGDETTSEQTEGKTDEKFDEEAGEQTGDEAGDESDEENEEEAGEKSDEENEEEAGEKSDEEAGEESGDETTSEQTEGKTEEKSGDESGEKSDEEAGDEAGEEKSGDEAGEEKSGDEAGEEKSDEEAGEQTGDEAGEEKSDEEAGEQTGDEAGEEKSGDEAGEEKSGDEAGEEKSDEEAGEQTGDEAGEESDEEAGEQTGDESGEKSDEEAGEQAGDETGEKSDEENEEEAGEKSDEENGEEAGDENEEEDGEENEEEGEEPEEPEFTEGVREIPVNDCVVTLSWSAEAHIPADVEIVIHEIKKGTEDYDFLYNQALAELPEPEQAVTQVMRFFDITLYNAEGEKIEPEAPVSVQVKVNEAIDGDVNALHCEEVGAPMQTVDANAEGKSVAFDAPSFSVYGVNYTKPAQQENISAEVSVDLSSVDLMSAATVGADGVTLSVSDLLEAKDEGVQSDVADKLDTEAFVKDAAVTSSDVQVQDGKITLSTDALEKGTVSLQMQKEEVNDYVTTVTTQTVEIKLTDYAGRTEGIDESNISVTALGDNSLPADAKATVEEKTSVPEGVELEEGESAAAFDITIKNQKGDVISETGSVAVTVKPSDLNVLSELPEGAVATDIRYQLVHIHDDGTSETIDLPKDAVVVDETGKVESFSFETESFSTYIFKYTVDFEYIDEEGEAHTWYFPGTGSYRIAEVLAALGIEAEEITSAELELVKAVGETSEAALYLTQDEDGEWWINSDEAFDDTYELTVVADGKTYVITVTDDQEPTSTEKYHVSLAFQKNDGTPSTPSEDKYYIYAAVKMPTDTSSAAIYYYSHKFDLSNPSQGLDISWFKRENSTLNGESKNYYSYDEVLAANKSVTIKLVKSDSEYFVQTNNDEVVVDRLIRKGEIKSGTVIEEGDVTDGYAIAVTKGTNSTSYVGKKPNAFYYTVAVDNIDGTDNLHLNDQIWYVYATVGRSDGTYVYAKQLTSGMIGQSVQLDVFHYTEKPDNDYWTTVAKTGENVQFSLVRAKDESGDDYYYTLHDSTEGNEWKYFSDSVRINSTAANGGSVANRYTLNVVGSTLTLKETRNHTITLAPYTVTGKQDSSVDLTRTDGRYYVIGRMVFRDGIVNKTRYYASKVVSGLEYTISEGFKDENGADAFLLTGARSYEPGLAFVPNTISDKNAFNKIATLDEDVEFFWNGDSVESYRLTAGKGTVEEPNTTVTLRKLPQITVNGEVHGADGNATALVGSDHYTLLARLEKDGVVGYAYVPLSFDGAGHMTATSFNSFDVVESDSPRTIYKAEEDAVQYYVVKTDSAVASLSDALAGTRYMAGQLMGDYTPEITAASDSVNVVLARTEVHPITYNVDIRILNKELNAYASDINLGSENYFVLASLVPKNGNQVVAWKVIPVDKTDLTADGQWRYTLQTNDFKVCDFAGDAIGTEVTGYDPNLYDLKLRLYHSANSYDTYNDLRDKTKASDLAPSGYDIVGVYTKDDEYQDIKNDNLKITETNTSAIRLHAAYTKQYRIKVYVDKPGLVIPAGDDYLVWTKLEHANSGGTTNALGKLILNGETEKVLDFYPNSNGGIWFDGNTGAENYTFTGNEHKASITIVKPNTAGWSLNQQGHFSWLNEGESINFYSWHAGERETEESVDPATGQPVTIIYDVIRFTKDNGISKGVIDDFLSDATDFGLYTLDFAEDTADMEANVAAHELTAGGMVDYGFSTNNIFINRLRVMKKYMEDGSPVSREVKLRLYKDGELQDEVTRTTGADGILYYTFENLAAGTYEVREFVDNQEVSYGVNGITTTSGGTTVTIMDPNIVIDAINTNINYFGSIKHDIHSVVLAKSRQGLILVDSEEDYLKLLAANGGDHEGIASVYMAGTENKPSYNIPEDMQRLRNLSRLLATSASSQTVRIVNVDLDTFNTESWRQSLADDGRYVVLNIDVTGKDVVDLQSTITLGGHELHAQFGKAGSEDASHVLYNIITRDKNGNAVPFNGTLTSAKQGAGVLLAPSAVVYGANGNWGGTIIAKEYHHVSGEIHSENTNKIVTKNTSLINEKGTTTQTGSLKLAKVVQGINDRTTYFTFRLTLKDREGTALSNQEFTITGLSDRYTIQLDANGQVDIPVRAMGDVTILGLPVGTLYEVEEVVTPETEHFHLIQIVDADGNVVEPEAVTGRIAATGDIAAQEIDVVTVQNAHKVGGLTVMKTVVGDITGNKKFHFKVTLKPNGEVTSEDIQNKYFGIMHFTPEGENSVYEFDLGNGESLTAKEIPTGTKFTVEETPVAGFVPSVNLIADVPEGEVVPRVNGATVTGEIIEDGEGNKIAIIAAYKNAHYEGASYVPKVTKELVINGTTTPVSGDLWPEGGFEFTITPASDNPNGVSPTEGFATKTATVTGKTVSFDMLTFTSSESDEWPLDPVTNTRNRTFTYTITETVPGDAVSVSDNATTYEQASSKTGYFKKDGIFYSADPITVTIVVGPREDEGSETLLEIKSVQYSTDIEAATTAEDIDDAAGAVINKVDDTTNISVEKRFDPALDGSVSWEASFKLQSAEKLISSDGVAAQGDWSDFADVAGQTFTLYVNKAGETDKLSDSIAGLPKYVSRTEDGHTNVYELKYTVVETALTIDGEDDKLEEYVSEVTVTENNGTFQIVVVNSVDTSKISLTVEKKWVGGDGDAATLYLLRLKKGYVPPKSYIVIDAHNASGLSALPTGMTRTYSIVDASTNSAVVENAVIGQRYEVAAGAYIVHATVDNTTVAHYNYQSTPDQSVTVAAPTGNADVVEHVSFTSTWTEKEKGSIAITQVINKTNAANAQDSSFHATYTATNGTVTKTGSYDNASGGATISGLDDGTYTVTISEVSLGSYGVNTATTSYDVSVSDEQSSSVTFTTTVTGGSLTINHTVTGDYANQFTGGTYRLNGGTAVSFTGSQSITVDNLEPGSYTVAVSGAANEGYQASTELSSSSVTVSAGNTATVTATHTVEVGSSKHTLSISSQYAADNGHAAVLTYKYQHGTTVTIVFENNNPGYNPFTGVHVVIGDTDHGEIEKSKSYSVVVNSDVNVLLTNTDYSNWGNVTSNMSISPSSSAFLLDSTYQLASAPRPSLLDDLVGIFGGTAYAAEAGNTAQDLGEGVVTDTILNGTGITIPEGYEVDTSFGKGITLSSGHWTETVKGLEVSDSNNDPYYYVIVEAAVPENYEVSYTNNPVNAREAQQSGTIATLKATNTVTTKSIYAKKVWKQGETVLTGWPAGISSVTFQLQVQNGGSWDDVETAKTVTNFDAVRWEGLDVSKTYKVIETAVNGKNLATPLEASGEGTVVSPFAVTNTVDTVDIPVEKAWEGIPPAGTTVEVELYKDGVATGIKKTLSTSNSWRATFTGLDKYDTDGTAITYKVVENKVTYYGQEYTGNNLTTAFGSTGKQSADISSISVATATLSNTVETKSISAKKTWNNSDTWLNGMSVTFTLSATNWTVPTTTDGTYGANTPGVTIDSLQTVNWTNLPKYAIVDGAVTEITYSVSETAVTYDGTSIENIGTVFTITSGNDGNIVVIDNQTKTTERHATKVWVDDNDENGLRPNSITFTLSAVDSDGTEVNLSGYGINGDIAQTLSPDASGVWPQADWTNLPAYTFAGKAITYDVTESPVANYTQTGKTESGNNTITFTNTVGVTEVELPGGKTMKGGEAPGTYTFTLSAADGTPMPQGYQSVTTDGVTRLVKTVQNDGESFSFGKIKYKLSDLNGLSSKVFTYTVKETPGSAANIVYDEAEFTVTVTVTYNDTTGELTAEKTYGKQKGNVTISTPITSIAFVNEEVVEIEVDKTWSINDSDTWPSNVSQVVVGLFKTVSGEVVPVYEADGTTQKTVTLTSDKQKDSFTLLPKYDSGVAIVYSVKELSVTVDGVELTPAEGETNIGGFTVDNGALTTYNEGKATAVITNSTGTVDVPIKKQWKMPGATEAMTWYNGEDENTAKPINVTLYKHYQGENAPVDAEVHTFIFKPFTGERTFDTYTVVGSKDVGTNTYIFTVKDLPEKGLENGKLVSYTYTFKEEALDGFSTSYLGADGTTSHTSAELTYGIGDGGIIINTLITVSLPATGGSGTTLFYAAGSALLLLALLGIAFTLRRKARNGIE